jgi:hypothetical protein
MSEPAISAVSKMLVTGVLTEDESAPAIAHIAKTGIY